VVENRAGAAGSLGAKAVASADPDGYTLLCGNISTLVVLPTVSNNRDYDPSKVFIPTAKVSQNHEVLVVHPAFAAKSVPELVAYAKANPGKLNYGSAGLGNATHLAAELFKLRTGIDIVHVPYKG
jgi:tripartite-type tricarboxylate transporter receptor subunit TctC